VYANYLEVGQNAAEFALAFGTFHEGDPAPHMHVLVHTTPLYARAFCNLLQAALERYDRTLTGTE
jgi:hypothetical protein